MDDERIIRELEKHYSHLSLLEFSKVQEEIKYYYNRCYSYRLRKRIRDMINTYPIAEYKKEKIWMYLNNDITKEEFDYFVKAVHENWLKKRR